MFKKDTEEGHDIAGGACSSKVKRDKDDFFTGVYRLGSNPKEKRLHLWCAITLVFHNLSPSLKLKDPLKTCTEFQEKESI